MTYLGSAPLDGDWVWELPPDDNAPNPHDCLARGEASLAGGAYAEALRQLGLALLLEPGLPRAQLAAARALEGLGHTDRARELISSDSLAQKLGITELLSGLEMAGRLSWADEAIGFLLQAYFLRPSSDELVRLDELATSVIDRLFPELSATLPPEARPIRPLRARRNDSCPCGSGRKYKRCCLKRDQEKRGPAVRGEADNLVIVAFVRERDGKLAEAESLWSYLSDRYPSVPWYWARLARVRIETNDLKGAMASYERLARFPGSLWEDSVYDVARLLSGLGKKREALRILDSHPQVVISSAPALVLRAELLTQLGRLNEALGDLLRAKRLNPTDPEYLLQLAEVSQLMGENDAAGQYARFALDLTEHPSPDPIQKDEVRLELRLSSAAIMAGLGWDIERVLSVCYEVSKSDLDADARLQALSVRAYALLVLGRGAEAGAAVEEALAFGEDVELYLLGAAAASQLGDTQARVTYLREGVRCLEEDEAAEPDELAIGGLIAAIIAQYDKALSLADRALAANPESEIALPVRAHCLLRLDRAQMALATTAERRAADIASPLLVLTRAEALCRLGRYSEALAELAGPLPMEKGQLAPLLAQLQEVRPIDRRDMLRARALRHLSREPEALTLIREVSDRSPGYVEAWSELAEILLERGDATEAHRALLDAERLDSSNPRIRERLAYVEGMLRAAQKGRSEAELAVIRLLGRETWLSTSEAARLTLVSAEVAWRYARRADGGLDYGSVVAQHARVVELELHRRLFAPYRELILRTAGRDALRRMAMDEGRSLLMPFIRFLRAPQGGLSLGPMLAVIDAMLEGSGEGLMAITNLGHFVEEAFGEPSRVREILGDPGLRNLNTTRNQGLHRSSVGIEAARRCRGILLGESPGRGWLTGATRYIVSRPIEELTTRMQALG